MIAKLFAVLYLFAVSNAGPILYAHPVPNFIWRTARAPNVAFGFGSGFSSNIGGISHSNSIGAAFQSGDATAYGAGIGSDGNARGIGYASASPYPSYIPFGLQQSSATAFSNSFGRNYGAATTTAHNFGNSGLSVSSAQSHNGFGSAVSAVQNNGFGRYQSAISSAQNSHGNGYDAAISSASANGLGYGAAQSSAQNLGYGRGLNNFNSAVSASQNIGGYGSNIAQTVQQQGGNLQHSGASSINGPGLQAAQSHAVNSGYY